MRGFLMAAGVAGFLAVAVSGAVAAPVLDQDQSVSTNGSLAGTSNILIQSFRQASNTLTGVSVMFSGSGSVSLHVLEILDNLPGAGGNVLASGSAGSPAPTGVPSFVFFDFSTIAVTPETDLFFRLRPGAGQASRNVAGTGDVYSRGQFYSLDGNLSFPQFDLAFQTFAESSVAVPAPTGPVLMGFAILGLAVMRRKRLTLAVR